MPYMNMLLTQPVQVFLPALTGYVPDEMIQCLTAFLDFAFLARRSSHTMQTLDAMDVALAKFCDLREAFINAGVRPDGFSLPRQHALLHYTHLIKLFGSPNGLCSSITESRHITAVKRPWRSSNRHNALIQILRTNTRLSKLAVMRVDLGRRGLLHGDLLTHTLSRVSGSARCIRSTLTLFSSIGRLSTSKGQPSYR